MRQITRPLLLGLDIGTTTVSAAVADPKAGRQTECRTVPNDGGLEFSESFRHEQDPERIVSTAMRLAEALLEKYPEIGAVGVTGQMHGIVYIDEHGQSVSPLMTWQDGRAAERLYNGESACELIRSLTGCDIPPGYGLATHYYNQLTGHVPKAAVSFCTIMDFLVMRMTGRKSPIVHASNAAGFGLFDCAGCRFDAKTEALGISRAFLPQVTGGNMIAGDFRGIPVSVAIGDNQASFIGAVREEESGVLVNFGTGSQISFVAGEKETGELPERRPFVDGRCLLSGSALCGGRAYAMLKRFFDEYAEAAGFSEGSDYDVLNLLAEKALRENELCGKEPLRVCTAFCGTRREPWLRGSIAGIGEENFTPGQMALGILQGMVSELYGLYRSCGRHKAGTLVASGNAVQKNPVLRKLLAKEFGTEIRIPLIGEEAALGAALFAGVCSGLYSEKDVKSCIHYRGEI